MKHLFFTDAHTHYRHHNNRAEWLGNLIVDLKPDVVIDGGDTADMPSLCSYDHGKKSFQGRTYKQDIDVHNDFQERLWSTVRKAKRKMPRRVRLIGNHEQRISRAIEVQPELQGVVTYDDLELTRYYDTVVHYQGGTPGVIELDGIHYAHYLISGVMGRPLGGEHPAHSLLTKKFVSCAVGHSHLSDYCVRTTAGQQQIIGLVGGCFHDFNLEWAGEANHLYWRGINILNGVDNGCYDLQQVSIKALRNEYGK